MEFQLDQPDLTATGTLDATRTKKALSDIYGSG